MVKKGMWIWPKKMKENGIYTHVRFYNYVILILTTATIKNNV